MTDSLRHRCELLVANRNIIRENIKHENRLFVPFCAGIYASAHSIADVNRIKACRELIRENTGVFSYFRSVITTVLATALSLDVNPKKQLERTLAQYSELKQCFASSQHLPFVAYSLAKHPGSPSDYKIRTREIYEIMKKAHPFLVSYADIIFAAMLAVAGYDDTYISDTSSRCYELLKSRLPLDSAQTLSYLFTIEAGQSEQRCNRLFSLLDTLKARGISYGRRRELAVLGVLAMVDTPEDEIADGIAEVDEYLKDQPGFGCVAMGNRQRLMYAAMQVYGEYAIHESAVFDSPELNEITSLYLAEQAALAVIISENVSMLAASNGS